MSELKGKGAKGRVWGLYFPLEILVSGLKGPKERVWDSSVRLEFLVSWLKGRGSKGSRGQVPSRNIRNQGHLLKGD